MSNFPRGSFRGSIVEPCDLAAGKFRDAVFPVPGSLAAMPKDLLEVSRELKSLAEAGLRYSEGPYDLERYKRLHEIASELLAAEDREFRWPVEIGYATPKVDVRAAVIQEGKILLVREASSGQWTLPGGCAAWVKASVM